MSTNLTKGSRRPSGSVLTPEFRVSFPYVFSQKKAMDPTKEGKYSITMLFPKGADLSLLIQAVQECMTDKFGPDKSKWPKVRNPFRDQGEKADKLKGYEPGAVFLTATSKERPGVVDHAVQKIIDPSVIYAGCYAIAEVNAFYYDNTGNKGISFGLRNVQKIRDGEPLSSRSRPEDTFEPVAAGSPESEGTTPSSLDNLFGS